MKSTGVIWTVKAGQLASAAFISELIKHNTTAAGGALVDAKEGIIDMMKQDSPFTLDQFEQVQREYKDFPRVFWSCTTEKGINEDDVQPYVAIEGSDKKPLCLVFMSGDFSKFSEENSVHTDEWLAFQKRVKPKLDKAWRASGGSNDYKKFIEELNDPVFRDEMKEIWVKHGTITVVHFTGEIISFMDEDNYMEFPWGTSSSNYGYTEVIAAVAPAKEVPKSGLMGFRRKAPVAEATGTPVSPPAGPVQPAKQEPAPITDKPATYKPGEMKPGEGKGQWIQCPPNVNGKKNIRAYYEGKLPGGVAPNGFKDKPRIWISEEGESGSGTVATLAATVAAASPSKGSEVMGFRNRAKGQENAVASVEPVNGVEKAKIEAKDKKIGEDGLPILTSKQKKDLFEYMTKAQLPAAFVDNNQEIPSQEVLDNIEKEIPNFADQSGGVVKSLRDTFSYSHRDLVNLGYAVPEALAILCQNYRTAMFQNMKQNGTLPKKTAEAKTDEQPTKMGFRKRA